MFKLKSYHIEGGSIYLIYLMLCVKFYPAGAMFGLGAGIAGTAIYFLLHQKPAMNRDKILDVLKAAKYPFGLPQQVNNNDYHLIFKLEPGMALSHFLRLQEQFNAFLQGETEIYLHNNYLHIEIFKEKIPHYKHFDFNLKPAKKMRLPLPIGYSNEGFIFADLSELPHLLIGGQTYGGKSNFLIQAIIYLLKNVNTEIFIIDMKKIDFSFLKKYVNLSYTIEEAAVTLEYIYNEMLKRRDMLYEQEKNNIKKIKGFNYIVLIIDEFAQLAPSQAKTENEQKICKLCHGYLKSILQVARAVGIHVIISTQRPSIDVIHPQMKANCPASLAFRVRNKGNSEILLGEGNSKAAEIPRVKGRAIWQFDLERYVQVMHLEPEEGKKYLKYIPVKKSSLNNKDYLCDGTL